MATAIATEKAERLEKVNAMIRVMGSCGRRFFYSLRYDRFARMEIDSRGKVWFVDDYSGHRIYTHYERGSWRKFSHGGTMRALVIAFRKFIQQGTPVPAGSFGPWPDWYCGGDLWGYGDDMVKVRSKAIALGIVKLKTNDT